MSVARHLSLTQITPTPSTLRLHSPIESPHYTHADYTGVTALHPRRVMHSTAPLPRRHPAGVGVIDSRHSDIVTSTLIGRMYVLTYLPLTPHLSYIAPGRRSTEFAGMLGPCAACAAGVSPNVTERHESTQWSLSSSSELKRFSTAAQAPPSFPDGTRPLPRATRAAGGRDSPTISRIRDSSLRP